MIKTLFLTAAAAMASVGIANADIVIDFNDGTMGTLIETDRVAGAPDPVFNGSTVEFTGGGNDARAYLGTAESDWTNSSFTASIDVTLNENNGGFFGLGPGTTTPVGTNGQSFGEPSDGPAIFAVFGNVGFIGDHNAGVTGGIGETTSNAAGNNTVIIDLGDTETITFSYDAVAQTVTFSSTNGATSPAIPAGDNLFDGTNSRIFFGGSAATFDNLSVTVSSIPEPGSLAILGLVVAGLSARRRRA